MQTHLIKALYRATSKTYLIRAKSVELALKRVAKLKEHKDVYVEFVLIDVLPDDRLKAI
jgi:hypothetical protein